MLKWKKIPSPASLSLYHLPMLLVPQGRTKRPALKITTASPDSSLTRPSEYSSPTPTRARAFLRLKCQGRKEEARLHEAHCLRRSLWLNSAEASPEAIEQLHEGEPTSWTASLCLYDQRDTTLSDGTHDGSGFPSPIFATQLLAYETLRLEIVLIGTRPASRLPTFSPPSSRLPSAIGSGSG
jgi:hypothetical protein